ncbi:P-aminobenzoate N-oxygenase AurF [Streptoalloteichus tenebrarius]|uniref:p-aminobenzoate N-oxygenase AurF n=1 Tax=Streptoalloteichus tenebrarius (strain ATCC 17920 / DSM 40477 / JCM 4838 / CBS 697.72 / NBRC 16177 / NCIMB 11028 / NRRL B-12390 / A12253. 1 / ISP 5477) TaxID=1933 RepID=A0ABT1HVQ3_STRSD|nr:diiron oxygenase [Streptoalloteichus tenebrarius]MCP2259604.1 P-aminobenzoate N-oxygenase AurF [Streptoalloteichus tenebrarius]
MTRALRITDRERTAERLLGSSAKNSYDPELDLDWDAPLVDGMFFVSPEYVPIYGTVLWDRLGHEQRVELSRHVAASIASAGIWLEEILMQMLLRLVYSKDPRTRHVQYALTEIGDECRHTVMFGRMIERLGCPRYPQWRMTHELGRLFKGVAWGPSMFAATLIGEELLDRMQREMMNDERLQPLVRMVNRIHVVEEARHVRFAREELARSMVDLPAPALAFHRLVTATVALIFSRGLVRPEVYRSVGLDPASTTRVALANPHWQRTVRWAAERMMKYFDEIGLVGKPGMALWRKSFFLA